MRRILSIWLPEFPLERLKRAEPGAVPETAPFALVAAEGNRLIVSAANAAALAAGVRPGMGLADARAIAPQLASRPAEPAKDAAALSRLARWLVRYGPAFNTDGPDGLWVDVTGVTHLYGGDAGLAADLGRRLAGMGLTAELGLGDGLGMAWALGRFLAGARRLPCGEPAAGRGKANGELNEDFSAPGRQQSLAAGSPQESRQRQAGTQARAKLAHLPVEALRIDPADAQLLRRLGLKRIGQLYNLPRASIERRFRSRLDAVLLRLDQALGVRAEPLKPMRVPPVHAVRAVFPEPLISGEGLEAALAALALDLCTGLAAARHGARRLVLRLHRSDSTRATVRAGLSRPSRSPPHMLRLLREKLGAIDAGYGIDVMELAAMATEPLGALQDGLSGGAPGEGTQEEALAALIDRLASRLGPANVLRLASRASHLPERKEFLLAASDSASRSRPDAAVAFREPKDLSSRTLLALPAPGGRLPGGESPGASKKPLMLLPIPESITVVAALPEGPPQLIRWRRTLSRIVRAEGPERIAPEWWREIGAAASRTRDYYVAEDETGARFWLFRDGRHASEEDADHPPVWYLHGVFG